MARKGNPRLKAANEIVEMTPEQVRELYKCSEDPCYFIENYVKVQHPVRGAIPLQLYDYQKKMLKMYQNERYTIVLSARQTGKCAHANTLISVVEIQPHAILSLNTIKKLLLWIVNRKIYNEIYKDV